MRTLVLGLAFCGFLFGCKTAGTPQGASEVRDVDTANWEFTGFCRPNAGECRNSCGQQNCTGDYDPQLCAESDPGGGDFACYGPKMETPSGPPGNPEDWSSPICVRSAQECANTGCPTQIFAQLDPRHCPPGSEGAIACYCRRF